AGACSSDESTKAATGGEGNPALADVIYEGGTNDEALGALLDAMPATDPTKAAAFTAPKDGAMIPSSPPLMFTWAVGGPAARRLVPRVGAAHALAPLFEVLGPERAAHAHGAPLNGKAYFFVLRTASDDKLVRVFTTSTSFTPNAAVWQRIVDAKVPISATIMT